MVPYRNNVLGFKKSPKLKLPEFDSVFMLSPPDNQTSAQQQNVAVTQTSSASNTTPTSEPSDNDLADMSQVSDFNLTGRKLLEEMMSLVENQESIPPEFSNTATVSQPRGVVRVGTTFSSRTPTPPIPVSGVSSEQNRIARDNVPAPTTSPSSPQRTVRRVPTGTSRGGGY